MADIFTFQPRKAVEVSENVKGFIDGCRKDCSALGKDLDFDANQWDVSAYIYRRGKTQRVTFTFSTFDSCNSRNKWVPMSEPFLSFVKAKMRYDFGLNPMEQHSQKMAALRAIEKALVNCDPEQKPKVENIDPHVLNLAAQYLKESNPGSAFQSGCHLEATANWVVENQMTRTRFQWKNIIKKPEDLLSQISEEADEYRLKNIPPIAAIQALPQIFDNSNDPRDVLISSMTALMFSCPGRFNEFFALPLKCEVEDRKPDGTETFGFRWHTSKGGGFEIKKVLKKMVGISKTALERIRKETEEAREMARWYESNPNKLYLPKELEYLRNENYISSLDLAKLIGKSKLCHACRWANENGLKAVKVSNGKGTGAKANAYLFSDVERVICGMLPKGFPVYDIKTGLTFSNALLLVPQNFFHDGRGIWRCMFQIVDINTFNRQLGKGVKRGISSVFSRNNFTEKDGSPIELDSHDFRHYLSYLMRRKGIDNVIQAMWAGRKRVADTKRYGDPQVAEKTKLLRESGADVAKTFELVGMDVNDPECPMMFEDVRDILELQYQYVHETRFGYCVHNYDVSPCERRMQCLECSDHICIKGLKDKEDRARDEFERAERSLGLLRKAIVSGIHAEGSKLHKYLKRRVCLLQELIDVFNNPEIPEGTKIQITVGAADTPMKISLENRKSIDDREGKLLAETARATQVEVDQSPALLSE